MVNWLSKNRKYNENWKAQTEYARKDVLQGGVTNGKASESR